MRTNRVVRKSIKRLRSKNRRNRVNRKTKKRIQKRTKRTQKRTKRTQKRTKRAKRSKNNRKTKKIKRSYELTGGMFPGFFEVGEGDIAAQRQQEQMKLKKTEAKERKSQYLIEEEKAKELFEEYLRIIHIMKQEQLVEILTGLKYEPYLIDQVRDIIKSSDRKKLIEMVFSNTSRLRQVNRELWNKYFADSEIILNYYQKNIVKKKIDENKVSKIFKQFKL